MAQGRALRSLLTYLSLTIASVLSLFPIFWMISVSLRPNVDIFRIPPISLVIPYFIMIVKLKLCNTYLGLILTFTAFVLPFSTLMMVSYFNTVPQDLEEAAMVDGCTRVGALARVVLPGLAAPGVYAFLLALMMLLFTSIPAIFHFRYQKI